VIAESVIIFFEGEGIMIIKYHNLQ